MISIKENVNRISLGSIAAIITIVTSGIFLYDYYQTKRLKDLTGKWDIVFYIDESTYTPYIGKNTTNRIFFTQEVDKLKAEGEMIEVDKNEIPSAEHIPIHLQGKLEKNKIQILFQQDGAKRKTAGELHATISEDGNKMEGVFSCTAASSSGRIVGLRLNSK